MGRPVSVTGSLVGLVRVWHTRGVDRIIFCTYNK